jgi:C-terminal processing protease CtpA/Prc
VRFGYRVYPQSGFHLDVKPPEGDQKSLVVMAKVTPGQAVITHSDLLEWLSSRPTLGQDNKSQLYAVEKKVLFWKMPTFNIDPQDVGGLARKARSFETVVLDLRGNGGGSEDVLLNLLGHFFDHDVRIGDLKERKGSKPLVAKGHGDGAIGGKLIVLIDSNSASASEIFSRTIQLEKRGIVLGDRSEGAVMRAEFFLHAVQLNQKYVTQYRNQNFVTQYRSMVTAADLVLANGERLEGLGVKPDEPLIPTPADMAAGRDPVLSRAASLAGIEMTPAKAGEIFPFKWPSKPIKIE